jgi:hypothetical protein
VSARWPCDIEGRVDRQFHTNVAAERLEVGVGEGIVLGAHDLDAAGAVGADDGWNFLTRRFRLRRQQHVIVGVA